MLTMRQNSTQERQNLFELLESLVAARNLRLAFEQRLRLLRFIPAGVHLTRQPLPLPRLLKQSGGVINSGLCGSPFNFRLLDTLASSLKLFFSDRWRGF